MAKHITKIALLTGSIALLAGCSQLLSGQNGESAAPQKMQQTAAASSANKVVDLSALEKQAAGLATFTYSTDGANYVAYSGAQTELIKAQTKQGESQFFYKNGKLIAAATGAGSFQFNSAGKVVAASDKIADDKAKALVAQGNKLAKMLSYSAADKRTLNGDANAKLNYLCVTKIRQVAQTDRVFRSSPNQANSANQLTAEMRLNGNQFYKMDCQLEGDRVVKLSLMKK